MIKKFTVLFITAIFLVPMTTSAAVDLGEIDDIYIGDKVSTSWELRDLDKNTAMSVYFSNRRGLTKILVDDNKKTIDEIEFNIFNLPVNEEFRIEIKETGRPYHTLANTGWFKILGKRGEDVDDDTHFDYNPDKYILSKEDTIKFQRLRINEVRDHLNIDWKTFKDTKVALWATCVHELFLHNKKTGQTYLCPENDEEVLIHSFNEYSKTGDITLYPQEVTNSTNIIFKVYSLDEDGFVNGERQKTEFVTSNKNKKDADIEETGSKLDEILQLIKLLKLDVDVELIELLIRLKII